MPSILNPLDHAGLVTKALHSLVAKVPPSAEKPAEHPQIRAQSLAKNAALRSAATSGMMSLPPGPFGLLTVLPDILAIWRLQQQLIADIAAAYGRSDNLTPEAMVVCLFQHTSKSETNALLSRAGHRILIRRVAESTLRQLLSKIAIRLTRTVTAKGFSRWLPLVGSLGVGAYAYYETTQVAATAIEVFSKELPRNAAQPTNARPPRRKTTAHTLAAAPTAPKHSRLASPKRTRP